MRTYSDPKNNFGLIWSRSTKNFTIMLVTQESFEPYNGYDEDGRIASAIGSGEFVMFDSAVRVVFDGHTIGTSYLGSSVYKTGQVLEFLKSGYFTDMLREACGEARQFIRTLPKIRVSNKDDQQKYH